MLILEKAEAPITGSTALSAGGVRHQFAREVNIRLSKYSIERLKNFSEEIGGHADLRQTGYLFLINKEGRIVWFYSDSDITKRLTDQQLLQVVETRL